MENSAKINTKYSVTIPVFISGSTRIEFFQTSVESKMMKLQESEQVSD